MRLARIPNRIVNAVSKRGFSRLLMPALALPLVIVAVALFANPAPGAQAQQPATPAPTPTQTAQPDGFDIQNLSLGKGKINPPQYPNMDSMLNDIVLEAQAGGFTARAMAASASRAPKHHEQSVAVTLYITEGYAAAVSEYLSSNGASPRNIGVDYIEAYVPVSLLPQASERDGVISVRAIIPPQPAQGAIVSAGVALHGASVWHAAGYKGQGVKIGIIDAGYEGFSSLMGTELPATVNVRCYPSVGTATSNLADCTDPDDPSKHGTGVTEAVFDIAPQATYYISNSSSRADMRSTVNWMASQGVDVINVSLSWLWDGPGNGASPYSNSPLKTVDAAVAGGILWVNAAGNYASRTWFGAFADRDNDTIHDYGLLSGGGSKECNMVTIALDASDPYDWFIAQLRWDDRWGADPNTTQGGGASKDLDLYLLPEGGTNVPGDAVASSASDQTGGANHEPFEVFAFRPSPNVPGNYCMVVVQDSGSAPSWLQLQTWHGRLDSSTAAGSIGNPAESANSGMLAVGATLPYGPPFTVEGFSSKGPTPDGRTKPDIVGANRGNSRTYGVFAGTSQASPHVAGLAALVKQRNPSYTPRQLANYLKTNAVTGSSRPNNTEGYGFAYLPVIPTNTPSPTPIPPTATRTPSPTPIPPTATPTPSPTPIPPTATRTPSPTPIPPTATRTPSPTPIPPTATRTPSPTPIPPTATRTPSPTPILPTATPTSVSTTPTATPTTAPVPDVAVPTDIGITVSSGGKHACALHKTTGSILCWGDNEQGQASPPATGAYIAITGGESHTCALRSDGAIVCWGSITVNPQR